MKQDFFSYPYRWVQERGKVVKLENDEVVMSSLYNCRGIVQGQPYDRFYKPTKDYAKSPIYQLLKISSLELSTIIILY